MESEKPTSKPENIWTSLLVNVFAPVVLLNQGDKVTESAAAVLVIALAFPVGYFFYDLATRGKRNIISIIGFISIMLTGGIGLMQLPRQWFIIKEAAIPLLIGLAVVISLKTPFPLIRSILFQPQIFRVDLIKERLKAGQHEPAFNQLMVTATWILAGSFVLSSVLNYLVASHFIQTEPAVDQAQFNREVGAMTGWSYVIIALPSMVVTISAMIYLVKGLSRLTGLKFEEMMHDPDAEKQS